MNPIFIGFLLVAFSFCAGCDSFTKEDLPADSAQSLAVQGNMLGGESLLSWNNLAARNSSLDLHPSTTEITPGHSLIVEGSISSDVSFDRVLLQLVLDDGKVEDLLLEIECDILKNGSRFIIDTQLNIPANLLPSIQRERQYFVGFSVIEKDETRHGSFQEIVVLE